MTCLGRVQGRLWSLNAPSRSIINVILGNDNAYIFVKKISSVILIEVARCQTLKSCRLVLCCIL